MNAVTYWANYVKGPGEVNTSPSKTLPDQTLPLRALLERYVRGQEVHVYQPVFNGEHDDMPDVTMMDPMEKMDLARDLRAGIAVHRAEMAKRPPKENDIAGVPQPDIAPPAKPASTPAPTPEKDGK